MRLVIVAVAAAAATVGTVAVAARTSPLGPPPESGAALPKGQCLRTADMGNHIVVDKNTLLLGGRRSAVYRVTMRSACLNGAVSSDPIGLRSPPGQAVICKPSDLDLRIRGGLCFADSIVQLTPEEVALLPRGMKP